MYSVLYSLVHFDAKSLNTTSSANAEITRVGGHYAVQGHSRSLMLYQSKARLRLPISEYNTCTKLHPLSPWFPVIARQWSKYFRLWKRDASG